MMGGPSALIPLLVSGLAGRFPFARYACSALGPTCYDGREVDFAQGDAMAGKADNFTAMQSGHATAHGGITRRGLLAGALLGVLGASGCTGESPAGSGSTGSGTIGADLAVVTDSEKPARVTVMMVGDMLVHPGVWMSGERDDGTRNYDHLFANLSDDFSGTDIAMVNQETILGGAEHGLSGYPTFNSPQELGDAEVAAGVDVSISATNHALDRGFAGITWALEYWRTKHPEILVPGIADTQDKADEIPMLERNGVKVAILNYTESTNGIPIPSDAPFCVKTLGEADFASDMTRAREAGAEFIVVCPHWGTEYVYKPTEEQIRWASELVEAGADVIIGTHPHVLEPVEVLDGPDGRQVPVFWSLGNYISWQAEKPRMVGGMAKVTLERRGGECRVVDYSLTPLVSHLALSPAMSVYRLADYTEELAAQNAVRSMPGCSNFTVAYCRELVAQILGEGYDAEACQLAVTL